MFKLFKRENCLKIDSEKTYYKHVFYVVMICSLVAFFLLAFASCGVSFKGMFFADPSDSFMDHYNSVVYNAIDPYENGVVYPPLATFTYGTLLKIIPEDDFNSIVSDPTALAQPRDLKTEQGFVFQFLLFSVATLLALLVVIYVCKKGSMSEKVLFSLLIMFTTPVLFACERGNNILLPMIFSLVFVNYYDSKSKWIKEIALICFALAVAFKLYPIAFGVLLFRNKQYKELFRAAIYCIILTILPFFLFYNGLDSMNTFIGRLTKYDGKKSSTVNINGQLSFKGMFYYIAGVLRLKFDDMNGMSDIFRYVITGMSIAGTFFTKSNWKAVALCACFICGFQGLCPQYLLVFFIVPVFMLLDGEKKNSIVNYACLICFILIMIPLVLPDPNTGVWSVYTPTKLSSLSILALVLIISTECVIQYTVTFAKFIHKKVCKTETPVMGGALDD